MELLEVALSQGITSAIIVVIYLIIVRLIDLKKEKNSIKLNNETLKSISTISQYIVNITENIINKDKEKCKKAVYNTITCSNFKLIQFFQTTLLQNHIKSNKSNVLKNIHTAVLGEYYNIYSDLNMFQIDGVHVCEYFDKNWIENMEESIIDILYKDEISNDSKLTAYINKVSLESYSYISYIINKINK